MRFVLAAALRSTGAERRKCFSPSSTSIASCDHCCTTSLSVQSPDHQQFTFEMNARIEDLETQKVHAQVRLAEELEEVRRSFRAELAVPYRGGALVRAADVRRPFRSERRPDGR